MITTERQAKSLLFCILEENGMLLGTYYPAERKFVNGRGDAIIIADDGTAKYTDGTDFGKVTDNGFSTKGIPQMIFDAATGRYTTEGIVVGEIKDEGGANIVTYNGKDWMQTSAPIDHKILAFITYGTSFSSERMFNSEGHTFVSIR